MPKGCGNCEYKLARDISSQQCQACVAIHKCWLEKQRSESSRERFHYMQEMSHLEKSKVIVNGNGHPMSVGFSRKRNAHLYADTFGRTQVIKKEDLKNLDQLLANAKFVTKTKLYKQRKDNIKRFYYYEVLIHGRKTFFDVAEEDFIDKNGKIKHQRYLYSITDKIKNRD